MLPERVWRIGHVSAPLSFPPSNVRLYAGRFDDPEHEYGTLYCSESSLTCIREVLADLRPSMEFRATFEKQFGDSPFVPAGVVSWSFRQSRALAPAHVVVEGDVIDLTQEETLRKLESHHAALLANHGFQHLDIAEMLTKTRSLTQAISRSLYNQGIAAIRYPSHLDYTPCWAIFEGRAHLETDGHPQLLTEDIPEILQVCSDYSLVLRRIAIGIEQEVEIMLRISQLREEVLSLRDREKMIFERITIYLCRYCALHGWSVYSSCLPGW